MHPKRLDYQTGLRIGLPASPQPGHTIKAGPYTFVWYSDNTGIGDLGFWGVFTSILGAVTGLIPHGGSDKQARQAITQQQQEIDTLTKKVDDLSNQPSVDKNTLIMISLAVLGLMFFIK